MHRPRPELRALPLLLLASLLLPSWAVAQEEHRGAPQPAAEQLPAPPLSTEIYRVRHGPVEELSSLIRIFDVDAQANPALGVIGLRGSHEDVAAALTALQRLDVPAEPSRSVGLTLWVLLGGKDTDGGELPAGLEPVSRQLAGALGYQSFELLDTLLVRTRHRGSLGSNGTLRASEWIGAHAAYQMNAGPVEIITREDGDVVRLSGFTFHMRPQPRPGEDSRATHLRTDVEVKPGQKVVVGKATASPGDLGLILVLEAEVE